MTETEIKLKCLELAKGEHNHLRVAQSFYEWIKEETFKTNTTVEKVIYKLKVDLSPIKEQFENISNVKTLNKA